MTEKSPKRIKPEMFDLKSLPFPPLSNILWHLGVHRKNARLVCKQWNELLAVPKFNILRLDSCVIHPKYEPWSILAKTNRKFGEIQIYGDLKCKEKEVSDEFFKFIGENTTRVWFKDYLELQNNRHWDIQNFLNNFSDLEEIHFNSVDLAVHYNYPKNVKLIKIKGYFTKTIGKVLQILEEKSNADTIFHIECGLDKDAIDFICLQKNQPTLKNRTPNEQKIECLLRTKVTLAELKNLDILNHSSCLVNNLNEINSKLNQHPKIDQGLMTTDPESSTCCFFQHSPLQPKTNLDFLALAHFSENRNFSLCQDCLDAFEVSYEGLKTFKIHLEPSTKCDIDDVQKILSCITKDLRILSITAGEVQNDKELVIDFPDLAKLSLSFQSDLKTIKFMSSMNNIQILLMKDSTFIMSRKDLLNLVNLCPQMFEFCFSTNDLSLLSVVEEAYWHTMVELAMIMKENVPSISMVAGKLRGKFKGLVKFQLSTVDENDEAAYQIFNKISSLRRFNNCSYGRYCEIRERKQEDALKEDQGIDKAGTSKEGN